MVGLTMRNNLVEDTQGMAGGLWCDLDCRDAVFVYNTVRNNPGGPAIFYEVSDRGIIAANVLSGSTYGISVASANTKIYNNTLIDNVQGINVYDDPRSPGVDGWDDVGPDTRNVEVVNNVISGQELLADGLLVQDQCAGPEHRRRRGAGPGRPQRDSPEQWARPGVHLLADPVGRGDALPDARAR